MQAYGGRGKRVTSATVNSRRQVRAKKPSRIVSNHSHPLREGHASLVPEWTSLDLFKGSKEISIRHNGAEYRLRITAANKLILTK
jgi:hemin uptake protein HemP